MEFFVVPTIGFKLLYGFVIVRLDSRELVWINVTTNPTAKDRRDHSPLHRTESAAESDGTRP
jgi:hypothetical protein